MLRAVWICLLIAGAARGETLRDAIAQARSELDAGRWRPARDAFVRVLVTHGRGLTGDARARIGLAAARASFRAGDEPGAAKLLRFAAQQESSPGTRVRIDAAQRRLEAARGTPVPDEPLAPADAPASEVPTGEEIFRDLTKSQKETVAPEPPATPTTAAAQLHVAPDGGVRFQRIDGRALQTAYAVYRRPGGGPEVHLAGMVHIGVKSYYEAVVEDLKYVETVLMEGLRGASEQAETSANPFARGRQWGGGGRHARPTEDASGETIVGQWTGMITLRRSGIEMCDMSYAELQEVEEKRFGTRSAVDALVNGDLFDQLPGTLTPDIDLKEWAELLVDKARPSLLAAARQQLLELVSSPPPEEVTDYLILTARNDHVMEALEKHLHRPRHHRVAICYGSAHMPDLHQRLTAMGYLLCEVRWNTVWRF